MHLAHTFALFGGPGSEWTQQSRHVSDGLPRERLSGLGRLPRDATLILMQEGNHVYDHSRSRLAAVATLALAATALAAPTASMASDAVTSQDNDVLELEGPSVIDYGPPTIPLVDPVREVWEGNRTPTGGCEFLDTLELAVGTSLQVTEIAYDPALCLSLVVIGTPAEIETNDQLREMQSHEDAATDSGSAGATAQSSFAASTSSPDISATSLISQVQAAAGMSRRAAYTWSWHDEPARWAFDCDVEDGFLDGCTLPPVNTARNSVEWKPGGTSGCVAEPGSTATMAFEQTWLVYTGWQRTGHTWINSGSTLDCDEKIRSTSYATFKNAVFCNAITPIIDFAPTFTNYSPNSVVGKANGRSDHTMTHSKSGGCSSLLRFNSRVGNNFS